MDPDKVLEQMRAYARLILDGGLDPEHEAGAVLEAAEMLASRVHDLDSWLSKGGYLPLNWARRPLTQTLIRRRS